jgi:hypothetical protein
MYELFQKRADKSQDPICALCRHPLTIDKLYLPGPAINENPAAVLQITPDIWDDLGVECFALKFFGKHHRSQLDSLIHAAAPLLRASRTGDISEELTEEIRAGKIYDSPMCGMALSNATVNQYPALVALLLAHDKDKTIPASFITIVFREAVIMNQRTILRSLLFYRRDVLTYCAQTSSLFGIDVAGSKEVATLFSVIGEQNLDNEFSEDDLLEALHSAHKEGTLDKGVLDCIMNQMNRFPKSRQLFLLWLEFVFSREGGFRLLQRILNLGIVINSGIKKKFIFDAISLNDLDLLQQVLAHPGEPLSDAHRCFVLWYAASNDRREMVRAIIADGRISDAGFEVAQMGARSREMKAILRRAKFKQAWHTFLDWIWRVWRFISRCCR